MRKTLVSAITIVMAFAFAPGGATASAAANRQHFTVVGTGQLEELRVAAAGVINAVGTDIALGDEEDPATGTLTLRDEFAFAGGSLFVTAVGRVDFNFDPRTCIRSNTFEGDYRITGGTGAYEGFTGGGTYSGRLLFFERGPEGCSDGAGHGVLVIEYRGDIVPSARQAA